MNADKPVERQRFYKAILEILSDGKEMTAREVSEKLVKFGLCHFGTRQESQPRLVEMCDLGLLERAGSKFDAITQKTVTSYKRRVEE